MLCCWSGGRRGPVVVVNQRVLLLADVQVAHGVRDRRIYFGDGGQLCSVHARLAATQALQMVRKSNSLAGNKKKIHRHKYLLR